jgi:hypothetical protein
VGDPDALIVVRTHRASTSRVRVISDLLTNMSPQAILVSDWLISKKSSSLKAFGEMNRNLVGSNLGRASINNAYLVPIRLQTWLPQAILVSDWLRAMDAKSSHCLWQGELIKLAEN